MYVEAVYFLIQDAVRTMDFNFVCRSNTAMHYFFAKLGHGPGRPRLLEVWLGERG